MPVDAFGAPVAALAPAAVTAPTDPLFTAAELDVWVRGETVSADDPFAQAIISAASLKLREECKHPEWTAATVPAMPKLIALQLAKRSYENDRGVVGEGGIGPIGGDRFLEDYARSLQFLDEELAQLASYGGAGGSTSTGVGELWVQPTTGGTRVDETAYYFTQSQNGDVSDWAVPLLAPEESWLGRPAT